MSGANRKTYFPLTLPGISDKSVGLPFEGPSRLRRLCNAYPIDPPSRTTFQMKCGTQYRCGNRPQGGKDHTGDLAAFGGFSIGSPDIQACRMHQLQVLHAALVEAGMTTS